MIQIQKRNVVVFAIPITKATTAKHSLVARTVILVLIVIVLQSGHSVSVTFHVAQNAEKNAVSFEMMIKRFCVFHVLISFTNKY